MKRMLEILKNTKTKVLLSIWGLYGIFSSSSFASSPAEETTNLLKEAQKRAENNPVEMPEQMGNIAFGVVTAVQWGALGLGLIFVVKVLMALYKGMSLEGREFKQVKKDLGKDFILMVVGFSLFSVIFLILKFVG